MKDKRKNVAQSVRDRLRTVTVRRRLDYNLVLTHYVLERLLYRLSVSSQRDRFALKGAMLFAVWTTDIIRNGHCRETRSDRRYRHPHQPDEGLLRSAVHGPPLCF